MDNLHRKGTEKCFWTKSLTFSDKAIPIEDILNELGIVLG